MKMDIDLSIYDNVYYISVLLIGMIDDTLPYEIQAKDAYIDACFPPGTYRNFIFSAICRTSLLRCSVEIFKTTRLYNNNIIFVLPVYLHIDLFRAQRKITRLVNEHVGHLHGKEHVK